MESKFVIDAKCGLGSCGQYHAKRAQRACNGFYGPGSDVKGTAAWCRLENWDNGRTPRNYWTLGKAFFQPSLFLPQQSGHTCPFRDGHYQLMRNFLLAAALAQVTGMDTFGTIVICPKAAAETLGRQVTSFKTSVLLDKYRDRVQLAFYDDYIDVLKRTGNEKAISVADFLKRRMDEEGRRDTFETELIG